MKTKILSALLLSFVLFGFKTFEGKSYKVDKEKTQISVSGTSSLHDWETNVKKCDGDLTVQLRDDNTIENITYLYINFFSSSFNSGKSSMDDKTTEALKAEKFPLINFKLVEIKEVKDLNKYQQFVASGKLTIAGVTKLVDLKAISTIGPNGEIYFQGNKTIDMTDYGITPPTAVFGTIKSGKDVTISYKIYFN